MTQIALRIHVGTLAGARQGVPLLIDKLLAHQARATFLLCLGPDRSGRAFGQAMAMARHCGWKTPLRGTLIPAGEIGKKAADSLSQIEARGFEAGISAWNRVRWEKEAETASNDAIAADLERAMAAFASLFGHPPRIFGAPDWQAHRHQLRLLQRRGFVLGTDCRGSYPFLPVWQGEPLPCPQLPTTLPPLEELMRSGCSSEEAVKRLLEMTRDLDIPQVFSLRAEHEGLGYSASLEALWQGWQQQGHRLVALGDLLAGLDLRLLPHGEIRWGELPHRNGSLCLQGRDFLA
ncbi:4-deoxy-4-formamido-L-arabinose-phosphoundecaprenol deformylase [Azovibrio restrictus]|uniref:4-deoxy-4-formamido-L-arabinose- phosphoundecaprenol deformylase n=1 Tax=Azovibrio restrictus TaxID=146938 RepID=UPI0026F37310|nr:4-deoxy-4-formamido-L-arabinose-phosphoundecaprenol deformylase [Azovibrio restrictus]